VILTIANIRVPRVVITTVIDMVTGITIDCGHLTMLFDVLSFLAAVNNETMNVIYEYKYY
jgi:hypothetical protein